MNMNESIRIKDFEKPIEKLEKGREVSGKYEANSR